MKHLMNKARLVLCAMLLLAFFFPAYKGYSALTFIPLCLSEASGGAGITTTDALILLFPLLMIPLLAVLLCFFFTFRITVGRIYLALPLVFFTFFSVLFFQSQRGNSDASLAGGLQVGFYLTAIASFLLLFTKDRKRKSRRRKRRSQPKAELAAQAL